MPPVDQIPQAPPTGRYRYRADRSSAAKRETEARRDLELLQAVSENDRVTQRTLARRLGIALGLANVYLKRLARKGLIKCVNVQSNRIMYLITPTGIAEKTRLTYEFMEYSLSLYRQFRTELRARLERCPAGARIAICGTGEAAELAYLTLRERGLEPCAIFGVADRHQRFLGMPVLPVSRETASIADWIVIATLEDAAPWIAAFTQEGVDQERLLTIRQ